MPLAYGLGGFINVPQGAQLGVGPPPANFVGQVGQIWIDTSTSPREMY